MINIVIGIVNLLFKDENIGFYPVKYLEENYKFDGDLENI